MRLTNGHTHHTSLIVCVDDVDMKVIYDYHDEDIMDKEYELIALTYNSWADNARMFLEIRFQGPISHRRYAQLPV